MRVKYAQSHAPPASQQTPSPQLLRLLPPNIAYVEHLWQMAGALRKKHSVEERVRRQGWEPWCPPNRGNPICSVPASLDWRHADQESKSFADGAFKFHWSSGYWCAFLTGAFTADSATHMRIKAITFDVGGTLIEPWPSVGHVYAEVAARFGVNGIAPGWLTENFRRVWKTRAAFDYSRESWFAIVRETFGEHAAKLPPEYFPAVFNRFAEADTWRIYDDVLPALETLARRGVKLGVISNWDGRLRPLLASLNLSRHFSSLVISCEVGATKPDSRLFACAAREFGVTPGEMLHVGDSMTMDVCGAEAFGATGRQVVRGKPLGDARQIGSLSELCAL